MNSDYNVDSNEEWLDYYFDEILCNLDDNEQAEVWDGIDSI